MKRTTVMLSANLKARATRAARERGVSLGDLVSESLRSTLSQSRKSRSDDAFFADKRVVHGGPADLAANHDKYLAEIIEDDHRGLANQ